jgi:hypothetical protein
MKKFFLLVSLLSFFNVQSQIVIDNKAPYNTPVFLIDNILLGGGILGSIGEDKQIFKKSGEIKVIY